MNAVFASSHDYVKITVNLENHLKTNRNPMTKDIKKQPHSLVGGAETRNRLAQHLLCLPENKT